MVGHINCLKQDKDEIVCLFYNVNKCQDLEKPGWSQKLHVAHTDAHQGHPLSEQNTAGHKCIYHIENNYVTQLDKEGLKRRLENV